MLPDPDELEDKVGATRYEADDENCLARQLGSPTVRPTDHAVYVLVLCRPAAEDEEKYEQGECHPGDDVFHVGSLEHCPLASLLACG